MIGSVAKRSEYLQNILIEEKCSELHNLVSPSQDTKKEDSRFGVDDIGGSTKNETGGKGRRDGAGVFYPGLVEDKCPPSCVVENPEL